MSHKENKKIQSEDKSINSSKGVRQLNYHTNKRPIVIKPAIVLP
jgi:hypothetical protein